MRHAKDSRRLRARTLGALLAVAAICAGVLAAISGAEQPATESTAVEPPAWFPKEAASILEGTDPSTARDLGSTDAGERVITVSRPGVIVA